MAHVAPATFVNLEESDLLTYLQSLPIRDDRRRPAVVGDQLSLQSVCKHFDIPWNRCKSSDVPSRIQQIMDAVRCAKVGLVNPAKSQRISLNAAQRRLQKSQRAAAADSPESVGELNLFLNTALETPDELMHNLVDPLVNFECDGLPLNVINYLKISAYHSSGSGRAGRRRTYTLIQPDVVTALCRRNATHRLHAPEQNQWMRRLSEDEIRWSRLSVVELRLLLQSHGCTIGKRQSHCISSFDQGDIILFLHVIVSSHEYKSSLLSAFVTRTHRRPSLELPSERLLALCMQDVMSLPAAVDSQRHLSPSDRGHWQPVLDRLQMSWDNDPVMSRLLEFRAAHGRMPYRFGGDVKVDGEASLYRELLQIRRARFNDVKKKSRDGTCDVIIRAKLSAADVALWESKLGSSMWRDCVEEEWYVAASDIIDEGRRHLFPRVPVACDPVPCFLCGACFDSKTAMLFHFAESHCQVGGVSQKRLEEEYRKRVLFYEEHDGPFVVSGHEVRQSVSNHARHQTHSYPGTSRCNFAAPNTNGVPRSEGSCSICAMRNWLEDLVHLRLINSVTDFVVHPDMDPNVEQCVSVADEFIGAREAPSAWRPYQEAGLPGVVSDEVPMEATPMGLLVVHPWQQHTVNRLLNIREYARRWPSVPMHELIGSSIQHPFGKNSDGTPWRWLVNTKVFNDRAPDGSLTCGSDGTYGTAVACLACATDLCSKNPFMPRYALANDNFIGRLPSAFRNDHGGALTSASLQLLSLARMCVRKVIAEPGRRGDPATKQKGLRANTICFPQAVPKQLLTSSLPASLDASTAFMAESISIALVNSDPNDLHNARWAQVPRTEYIEAARFLISHNVAYHGLLLDTDAATRFHEQGRSCPELLAQLTVIQASESTPFRLVGPADGGAEIQVGEAVVDDALSDSGVADGPVSRSVVMQSCNNDACAGSNTVLPSGIEEDDDELPLHMMASDLTSADLDSMRAAKEFAAKLQMLARSQSASGDRMVDVRSVQELAATMGTAEFQEVINREVAAMNMAEAGKSAAGWVIHTGTEPLSMYDQGIWQKSFPHLFPYGDGVYGIPNRARPMTCQQWVRMMLLRSELSYNTTDAVHDDCPSFKLYGKACHQCIDCHGPFVAPSQSRWSDDDNFMCCLFDTWRRMELVRRVGTHVRRKGFSASVKLVCECTADKLEPLITELSDKSGFTDMLRSTKVPSSIKEAVAGLLFFSSEVVGSDGARQSLRHEQGGGMLRFGGLGGFLTANVADTRHPIVVKLHAGPDGVGIGKDGALEEYKIDLLSECPDMPSATEMLKIIAKNPVAQAQFFIFSMRLFCEHVLGLGPYDDWLRHNGINDGIIFPDGYAASCLAAGMNMIASLHGPIEEQSRLSCHSHMVFQFVNRQSQAWLRDILALKTSDAKERVCKWQVAVLRSVEAVQISASCIVPLHFVDDPSQAQTLRHTSYLESWQREDGFDGKDEVCALYPAPRALVPVVPAFVDGHVVAAIAASQAKASAVNVALHAAIIGTDVVIPNASGHPDAITIGVDVDNDSEVVANDTDALMSDTPLIPAAIRSGNITGPDPLDIPKINFFKIPLTGGVASRLPHYRILPERLHTCSCEPCIQRSDAYHWESNGTADHIAEAAEWVSAFADDHVQLCSVSGHVHQHHQTCFKYIEDGGRAKPQHCRFGFVHFVHLWRYKSSDSIAVSESKSAVVEKLIARVGHYPTLPRIPGQPEWKLEGHTIVADSKLFEPASLGASVECDDKQAKLGRVKTVRFNPREGDTSMGAVPAHRGNLNYQDCRRTLIEGYMDGHIDALRNISATVLWSKKSQPRFMKDYRKVRSIGQLLDLQLSRSSTGPPSTVKCGMTPEIRLM